MQAIRIIPDLEYPCFSELITQALTYLDEKTRPGSLLLRSHDCESNGSDDEWCTDYVRNIAATLSEPNSPLNEVSRLISSKEINNSTILTDSLEKAGRFIAGKADRTDNLNTVDDILEDCRGWLNNKTLQAMIQPDWMDKFLRNTKTDLEGFITIIKKINNYAAKCLNQETPHTDVAA